MKKTQRTQKKIIKKLNQTHKAILKAKAKNKKIKKLTALRLRG